MLKFAIPALGISIASPFMTFLGSTNFYISVQNPGSDGCGNLSLKHSLNSTSVITDRAIKLTLEPVWAEEHWQCIHRPPKRHESTCSNEPWQCVSWPRWYQPNSIFIFSRSIHHFLQEVFHLFQAPSYAWSLGFLSNSTQMVIFLYIFCAFPTQFLELLSWKWQAVRLYFISIHFLAASHYWLGDLAQILFFFNKTAGCGTMFLRRPVKTTQVARALPSGRPKAARCLGTALSTALVLGCGLTLLHSGEDWM